MKCGNCVFWVEAQGTERKDNMGGCTFGINNYYPMFLQEDCGLKDIHKNLAEILNSKTIKDVIIKKTTFLKIYHKREEDGSMCFNLILADYTILLDEIKTIFSKKYNIPKYQVIVTYLYGVDDHEEIEMCEPLSKLEK